MAISKEYTPTCLWVSIFLMLGCGACGILGENSHFTRKLSSRYLCPNGTTSDCPRVIKKDDNWFNFIYTKAIGENDTLHYIISSYGVPSIFMARTSTDEDLQINWDKYMSENISDIENAISFSSNPEYVATLLLTKLIEYDDVNDTAKVTDYPLNSTNIIDLSEQQWQNCSLLSNRTSHSFVLQFHPSETNETATFSIMVELFGEDGRNMELPHLEYSANISHVTIKMDNLPTEYNNSRFALEINLISSDDLLNISNVKSYRSIDDGHSPGVFRITDWTSQGDTQTIGTFLQWKPIAYTGRTRNLTVATKAQNSTLARTFFHPANVKRSIALGYFGKQLYDDTLNMQKTMLSFGLPEDHCYTAYNYTLWVFSIGLGKPPSDSVSLFIILMISVGLGIPVMLIIVGGLGVCYKDRKEKKKGYQNINNEYSVIQ